MKQYLKNYSSGNQKGVITILLSVIMLTGIIVAALQITSNSITRMKRGQNTEVALKTQQAATSKRGEILHEINISEKLVSELYSPGGAGDCSAANPAVRWQTDSDGNQYCIDEIDEANGKYEVRVRSNDSNIIRRAEFIGPVPLFNPPHKFTASDRSAGDIFGGRIDKTINSVSISKNRVAIGASQTGNGGDARGAVYVYTKNGSTWSEQKLTSNTSEERWFGYSVQIYEDTLFVGAPKHINKGAVYIFKLNGTDWIQTQMLESPTNEEGDRFGLSLATNGKRLVVGKGDTSETKNVYVYDYNSITKNWDPSAIIGNMGNTCDDLDTPTVDIDESGNRIVVGLFCQGGGENSNIRVYNYSDSNWSWDATLTRPSVLDTDYTDYKYFGFSAAISGDGKRIVVGNPHGTYRTNQGGFISIYDYIGVGWSNPTTIVAPRACANDRFGHSVDISRRGTRIVVGSSGDSNEYGYVSVYDYGGLWIETKRIEDRLHGKDPFGILKGASFGTGVALSRDKLNVIVGAPYEDVIYTSSGVDAGAASGYSPDYYTYQTPVTSGTHCD